MVSLGTGLGLLAGGFLLLSNGFFVTTEFAMTRVRQFDEDEFREQGGGLSRAWEMTERLEIYLSGCQLGITISSVGLGFVAEPALAALIDPALRAVGFADLLGGGGGAAHTVLAIALALAIINLLHLIVGEQAPTYLGIERTKTVARYGAPVLYWWTKVMSPFIILADRTAKTLLSAFGVDIERSWAEEELEESDGDGGEGGSEEVPSSRADLRREMGGLLSGVDLSTERREEVMNALEIGDIPVSDIAVPREEIVSLSTERPLDENVERMTTNHHSRYPLVGDSIEDFLGIVYVPALLHEIDRLADGDLDLAELAVPPMTLSANTSVADAIDAFQAASQELAFLIDPDDTTTGEHATTDDGPGGSSTGPERVDDTDRRLAGAVVGLVTATDAFEAITGDLEDPLDRYGQTD